MFALASIDENVRLLNQKIDVIAAKSFILESKNKEPENEITTEVQASENTLCDTPYIERHEVENFHNNDLQSTLDFINQKYDIHIDINDNLTTIKEKVSTIRETSSSSRIFIQKILNANNKEAVITACVLHKAAHG